MSRHEQLIEQLSRDLPPVRRSPSVNALATAWLISSAVLVVVLTHLAGPVRTGAVGQLAAEPRFLLETLLGVVSIAWIGIAAFRAAVPGALTRRFAMAASVLLVLWLAQYVVGLVSPALEPSDLGERHLCYLETATYALAPILAGVFLVRRLYPLRYVRTAMALALAAGMIPALYMQIACMYVPSHVLAFHILPGASMVLAGAAVALLWPRRQRGHTTP